MEKEKQENLSSGSNGSPENVETGITGTVEIDGEKFEYREKDDEIQVILPEDISEDKRKSLEGKADEFIHTMASAKRKAFEANRQKDDLARQREELEREREAFRKEREMLSAEESKATSTGKLTPEAFGLETWDEVAQLQMTDPGVYHNLMAAHNATVASEKAMQSVRNSAMIDAINHEGYDANEVQRFAKSNGITNLGVAFDYFKRVNTKPSGLNLAEFQQKKVNFVSRGQGDPNVSKKIPSMKELLDESE